MSISRSVYEPAASGDRGERLRGQQRTPQVGVGDDAGGVDHAP